MDETAATSPSTNAVPASTSEPTLVPTGQPTKPATQQPSKRPPAQPTTSPSPTSQPGGYQNDDYQATPPPADPPALPYPSSDAEAKQWLVNNPLYDQTNPQPVRCDVTLIDAREATNAQVQRHVDELTACLMRVWDGVLDSAGFIAVRPAVTVYTQPIQTPCGKFETYNAYYCPGNQRVYYSPNVVQWFPPRATASQLTVLWIIAHEFGHVVQARSGIWQARFWLRDGVSKREDLVYNRRAELQADCLSGAFVGSLATALGIRDKQRDAIRAHANAWGDDVVTGDPNYEGDHGSGANRAAWVLTGVDNRGPLAACNTWVAPDAKVR